MTFRVELDAFHGPLDLLLYLVKKEELPIAELPLARLAEQYLEYVELLERLDVDAVGEFLDTASLLVELKSRSVLPQAEEGADAQPIETPDDLVGRLLEYKQFRDAAERLESVRAAWRLRRPRHVDPPPAVAADPVDQPLEGVELWDLVSAFARLVRERSAQAPPPQTIFYDDTPVAVHMRRIDDLLRRADDAVPFDALFPEDRVHKSTLLGVFLALLELVRYRHALVAQPEPYGPITLEAGPEPLPAGFDAPLKSAA